jgi:hypothetical protein
MGIQMQPSEESSTSPLVERTQPFGRARALAALIRDIGVIIGIPVVISVGMKLYDLQSKALEAQVKANEAQIKSLEAQNDLLKQTQYDRALSLLEGQKKVFQIERDILEHQIADLQKNGQAQVKAAALRKRSEELDAEIEQLRKQIDTIVVNVK